MQGNPISCKWRCFPAGRLEGKVRTMAVYLIQGVDGGPVKIGQAEITEARKKKIQRFSPVRLKLLAATAGGRRLETKLHRNYRKHRLWGEWFDLPAEKLAQLKEWMDKRPDWRWA